MIILKCFVVIPVASLNKMEHTTIIQKFHSAYFRPSFFHGIVSFAVSTKRVSERKRHELASITSYYS